MGNRTNNNRSESLPLNPINPPSEGSSNIERGITSVPTHQLNAHLLGNSLNIIGSESSFKFTFTFDSLIEGTMSVYFFAAESLNAKGATECYYIDTQRYPSPVTKPFPASIDQVCPESFEFDLNKYSFQELTFADRKTYPVIVELRTVDSPNIIESSYIKFRIGGSNWQPELIKQKFTYGPDVYELNEIFGHIGNDEETKECVVCLTNPKETLVVPCDHMCLCMDCANIMRSHYDSKCPMCRTEVQSLMHIIHT
ncbi:hypothetical protein SteCoe_326 [Stentor coeruleus]|uniref:RING-type domain-containing protein n=1 Tax=Stentor coeruleus TaxID=5963 RepID=A0A1R2D4F0_9CILI|nr:hypothetical protein SteCoe_326 [Stentor coeruleus]